MQNAKTELMRANYFKVKGLSRHKKYGSLGQKSMERIKKFIALIAALFACILGGKLNAQESSASDSQSVATSGALTLPIPGVGSAGTPGDKLLRPPRPDKVVVPEDVKSRLEQFKVVRETFLANQKDLTRKLKDATQEERDQIREQIQLQKQQFKARAKELAQQVKESVRDLDPALGHKVGQEGGTSAHGGRPDR
jgi:hypothetical protein